MSILVGLTGKSEVGKSLASEHLKRAYSMHRMAFASPLKRMMIAMGVPEENVWGDKKEEPLELLCGHSARHAMQTLGTEWGRSMNPNLWTNLFVDEYLREQRERVVVDDLRFDNEASVIQELGGIVVEIRRPTLEITGMKYEHASEAGVTIADYAVWNDGTPWDFREKLDLLMKNVYGLEPQGHVV